MPSLDLDVVGIGNAIVDVMAPADDAFLAHHGMIKGTMTLVDEERAGAIYAAMGTTVTASGGSAANTIAGIAALGGSTGFIGKIRADELGDAFRHDITAGGTVFRTAPAQGGPATARCLILVTPDSQRTMNTFLGASGNLTTGDIDFEIVEAARVVYLEGYLFDAPSAQQAFYAAAQAAHDARRAVALTLSDPFCVQRHRAAFLDLIERHVDVLFANRIELLALFQTEDFERALERVRAVAGVAAITSGADGSTIVAGDETIAVRAAPVDAIVDSTGAGDSYAAGFLFGMTRNAPLFDCGRLGSVAAAEILGHFGARPLADLRALAARALPDSTITF
jgi:sugar/nucleoside kinase (ribokinase family)